MIGYHSMLGKHYFSRSVHNCTSTRMFTIGTLIFLLSTSIAIATTACTQPSGSDLLTQYNQTIAKLGLQPVYPPREGFQVGDVYFRAISTLDPLSPTKSRSLLVGTIPTAITFAHEYANDRILFSNSTTNDNESISQIDFETSMDAINDEDASTKKMRSSMLTEVFPDISVTVKAGAAVGFLENFGAFLFSSGKFNRLSVSFPEVRVMHVPIGMPGKFEALIEQFIGNITTETNRLHKALLFGEDATSKPCERTHYKCVYTIITKVYYVREIDFALADADALDASLLALTSLAESDKETPRTLLPKIHIEVTGASGDDLEGKESLDVRELSVAVADTLRDALASSDAETTILSAGQQTQQVFTYKQKFKQPVAIAWDGFSVPFE